MIDYRYSFQPRKHYVCPNCGHKTLKRFLDNTTNQLIAESYGVCERIFSCGYEKRPNTEKVEYKNYTPKVLIPYYFNQEIMEKTLKRLQINVLFKFLCSRFDHERVQQTFERYKIGTSNFGDTIFWQIDLQGRIRAGKKIQYFSDGHRNKARGASWLHNQNGFDYAIHELRQTLFGTNLINPSFSKIYVVESEKTALICDIAKKQNDVLFLACGGLQNLGLIAKIKTDCPILCIPDNDGNEIWQDKINKLNLNAKIEIIPKLQEMKKGSDIGDLLLTI